MDRFAAVQDAQYLATKALVAQVIAQEQASQQLAQGVARLMNRIGPRG
jgi:hypothetical protein